MASTSTYVPTLLPNHQPQKIKRASRACLYCQRSKSRCDGINNEDGSSSSCRRCREAGVECQFRGPPRSNHDKPSNKASTSSNNNNNNNNNDIKITSRVVRNSPKNAVPHPSNFETRIESLENELIGIRKLLASHSNALFNGDYPSSSSNLTSNLPISPFLEDSVDGDGEEYESVSLEDPKTEELARQCFQEFFVWMVPYAAFISPDTDTYDQLLVRSPLLFYAILAVCSRFQDDTRFMDHCESVGLNLLRNTVYSQEAPSLDDLKGAVVWNSWLGKSTQPSHAVGLAISRGTPGTLVKLLKALNTMSIEDANIAFEENMPEVRTWLSLYSQDLWLSLASGRRSMVAVDFSIASTRSLLKFAALRAIDSRLIAQAELLTILAGVQKSFSRSQLHTVEETVSIIRLADTALEKWEASWNAWSVLQDQTTSEYMTSSFRMQCGVGRFYLNTLFLQDVSKVEDITERNLPCLKASVSSAMEIMETIRVYGTERVRHAIEFVIITAASAALFLLKMIKLLPSAVDIPATLRAVHETSQILQSVPAKLKQAHYAVQAALGHLESQLSPASSAAYLSVELPTSGLAIDPLIFGGQQDSLLFDPELELALSSVVTNADFWSWDQSLPADNFNSVLS